MGRTIATATGYTAQPGGYFNPTIYSKKMQRKFYIRTVLSKIANNDWEGEIKKFGSKVRIRVRPTVNIFNYGRGQKIQYQECDDSFIDLDIDQARGFAITVDEIDKHQNDIDFMNQCSEDAGHQSKITIEADVFKNIYGDVAAANVMSSKVVTKANILDTLIDMSVLLREQNVGDVKKWAVLPVWVCGMLEKSELRNASVSGGQSTLKNGRLGELGGFEIYESNNLYDDGTDTHVIAGTRDFVCFANQFVKIQKGSRDETYDNYLRGLNVYGYKATKPEAGVTIPVRKV